jgi:hypothetical protein
VTNVQAARVLAAQYGWRVWPGTAIVGGACLCKPVCCFTTPHPVGSSGEEIGCASAEQVDAAWSTNPKAVPLLVADGHVDLVGTDSDTAEGVLDFLADSRRLARPVLIWEGVGVFLVAPAELHRWRQLLHYGRGLQLLPWAPLPSVAHRGLQPRWVVPPTPTNSSPLPSFQDLSGAFVASLSRVAAP